MINGEDLRGIEYESGSQVYSHGHRLGYQIAIEEFIGSYYYAKIPRDREFALSSDEWTYDHFEYARQLGHVAGNKELDRLLETYSEDELRKGLSQPTPIWSQRRLLFLSASILCFGLAFCRRNPRPAAVVG